MTHARSDALAKDLPSGSDGISASTPETAPSVPRHRCRECGAFIGNGGWIPFGRCKKCGNDW